MLLQRPLETDRLILKTLCVDAADGPYLAWVNDADLTRHLELRFHQHTAQDLRDFIEDMNASDDNLFLGMFLKDGNRHVGNIKLGPINPHHKRADVGLVIGDRTVWGQGIATEVIAAVTGYGLKDLGLHRITAGCYADNIGSYKAFMKAGYTEDAKLKDYWFSDGAWQDEIIMYKLAEERDG